MPLKLLTKFTVAGIILTGFTGTLISNLKHFKLVTQLRLTRKKYNRKNVSG
ncbi:hypothetical protein MTR07_12040 [Staphylococcus agnetis]|uniref:hypothetical protein n=1 Tax=Staphylococcus agnetis TaxID=985762 RepID=UPI00208F910A|nr:hypothetical protein [Staphylococcus agnetis]MCO4351526.1 hypothetical protein [Staphylococcus agnetis]